MARTVLATPHQSRSLAAAARVPRAGAVSAPPREAPAEPVAALRRPGRARRADAAGRCAPTPPTAASRSAGRAARFSGASSACPTSADPTPTRAAPGAQLRRLGRVVSHELSGAQRGRRTRSSFQSANYRADRVGRRARARLAPRLLPARSSCARSSRAGMHTRRRAHRLAQPRRAGARRLPPHVVQLGRARRRGRRAPDRAQRAVCADARRRRCAPIAPMLRSAKVKVGVQLRNNGPTRTILPEGSLVRGGAAIPLAFAPVDARTRARASPRRHRQRRRTGAVVARALRASTCSR